MKLNMILPHFVNFSFFFSRSKALMSGVRKLEMPGRSSLFWVSAMRNGISHEHPF
jgi:hypothetical protein